MTYQPINWLEKIKFSQIGTNPEEPWHSWDHTSRDLARVDYGIFSFSFEFRTLKLFHTRMETCIIHYPHSLKILNWHFSWTPCRSNHFSFRFILSINQWEQRICYIKPTYHRSGKWHKIFVNRLFVPHISSRPRL